LIIYICLLDYSLECVCFHSKDKTQIFTATKPIPVFQFTIAKMDQSMYKL